MPATANVNVKTLPILAPVHSPGLGGQIAALWGLTHFLRRRAESSPGDGGNGDAEMGYDRRSRSLDGPAARHPGPKQAIGQTWSRPVKPGQQPFTLLTLLTHLTVLTPFNPGTARPLRANRLRISVVQPG